MIKYCSRVRTVNAARFYRFHSASPVHLAVGKQDIPVAHFTNLLWAYWFGSVFNLRFFYRLCGGRLSRSNCGNSGVSFLVFHCIWRISCFFSEPKPCADRDCTNNGNHKGYLHETSRLKMPCFLWFTNYLFNTNRAYTTFSECREHPISAFRLKNHLFLLAVLAPVCNPPVHYLPYELKARPIARTGFLAHLYV